MADRTFPEAAVMLASLNKVLTQPGLTVREASLATPLTVINRLNELAVLRLSFNNFSFLDP